jgi:hypothetical protein
MLVCLLFGAALVAQPGPATLTEAEKALADFRPEDAVNILARAQTKGPYGYREHARLYELSGIAHAYLEEKAEALEAFDLMLAIDPTRAISYTLSPKVTFLFEEARKRAAERSPPTLQVTWPATPEADSEIPVGLEVIDDPRGFLKQAVLFHRAKGAPEFEPVPITLLPRGERAELTLPAIARPSAAPTAVELYVVAKDGRANEVLLWGTRERPRELALATGAPTPWYGKWWVWAIAAGVVAAGATTAIVAVSREPGATVPGSFEVRP